MRFYFLGKERKKKEQSKVHINGVQQWFLCMLLLFESLQNMLLILTLLIQKIDGQDILGSQEDTMFTLNAKIGRIVLMYFDNDFVLAIGTTKTK